MTERLVSARSNNERLRRSIASTALALSFANILAGCSSDNHPESFNLPPITDHWSTSDLLTSIRTRYHAQHDASGTRSLQVDFDMLPAKYSEALAEAIDQPVVQLAVAEEKVDYIGAVVAMPKESDVAPTINNTARDNAYFQTLSSISDPEYSVKQIIVEISDGTQSQNERIFTDSWSMKTAVFHEAVHALNNEWWRELSGDQHFDVTTTEKVDNLKRACIPIGIQLYKTAYLRMGIDSDPADSPDVQRCAPAMFGEAAEIGEDLFKCVDEGHIKQDLFGLDYLPSGGHPYDNASELASSVTTALEFAPEYVQTCFEQQTSEQTDEVKQYIKSTLELSFSQEPALEEVLRKKQATADSLNFLME